jgi:hypothetical protein
MRILCVLLLTIGINQYSSAQVYTYHQAKKEQYQILNADELDIKDRIYQAAYDYKKFDELRFLDTTREIRIQGTDVVLILFSANELLDLYAKQISPFTIMPGQAYKEVELKFTDNKYPEFVAVFKD